MGFDLQENPSRNYFVNPFDPYGDGNAPKSNDDIGVTLRKILSATLVEGSGGAGEPVGPATGDLSGAYPGPTVSGINGTFLGGLASGLLFNTTSTGVPRIATANEIAAALTGTTGTLNLSGATVTLPAGLFSPSFAIQRIAYTGGATAAATIVADATHNIIAFLNGSSSSTVLTVTLPTGGFDGQTLDMSFNQASTTVAYAGATIIGALTVSAIGSRQRLIWDLTNTEWR